MYMLDKIQKGAKCMFLVERTQVQNENASKCPQQLLLGKAGMDINGTN